MSDRLTESELEDLEKLGNATPQEISLIAEVRDHRLPITHQEDGHTWEMDAEKHPAFVMFGLIPQVHPEDDIDNVIGDPLLPTTPDNEDFWCKPAFYFTLEDARRNQGDVGFKTRIVPFILTPMKEKIDG